jgi:glycosyltransferase involved in cell wall biosynthesis
MGRATVAIVLFNFNHERYLRESLGAISGQTRPADQIVIIDDGSTDDSLAIIDAAAAGDARVTVLRNGRNLGLQASMARALPLVTTDYLVWASAEDRLLPTFLEKSMPPLERHPDAGLCFSELSVVQGDTGDVVRLAVTAEHEHFFDLRDLPEYLPPPAIGQRMKRAYLPITGNSVVVRRTALVAVGGYPPELAWHADSFAHTVIALRFGACVVPEPLALFRVDAGSYAERGMRDPVRQGAMIAAMLDLLAQPRFRDVRRAFRRYPSNFLAWRTPMLTVQLRRRRHWDLFLAYAIWDSREWKRRHRLTLAMAVAKLGIRLVRSVRAWLHRRLAALARRLREGLRAVRGAGSAVRLIRYALAQRLGWLDARKMNVVASVRGPVTQEVVRNMVAWQLAIPRNATPGAHGQLCVAADSEPGQLDRFFSLLCLSGTFGSFDILFEEPCPEMESPRFDLCAPHPLVLGPAEMAGLQRAFLPLLDGRRTVTNYLKVAHPRAFVVALSLPEDEDGFADEALGKWLPHLHRCRGEAPSVAFCLLNRTMLSQDHDQPAPADVSPVRSLGFGLSDAVALAQIADAFIGRLDAFGLAAIGAHRPGVYIDPASGDRPNAKSAVWFFADASPEQCLDILGVVLRERRLSGRQPPTNLPAAGEPGTA